LRDALERRVMLRAAAAETQQRGGTRALSVARLSAGARHDKRLRGIRRVAAGAGSRQRRGDERQHYERKI